MFPLISTKLDIPWVSKTIVFRQRLTYLLDRGLHKKCVSLIAPGGYGKTTLLASWVTARGTAPGSAAWLSLDEQDDSPACFWPYLWACLAKVSHHFKNTGPDTSGELNIRQIINYLAINNHDVCLILDNFHHITHPQILKNLQELLLHQPRCLHIYFSSRTPLPFSLGRLRGQDQIIEIDADWLAFTREETQGLFKLALPEQTTSRADAAYAAVDGWPLGVKIALNHFRNAHPHASSDDWYQANINRIQDYLTEEVLEKQPLDLQQFLADTAALREFSAALCDQMRQRTDSDEFIQSLIARNLFVTASPEEPSLLRYRDFFQMALLSWAERRQPDALPRLRRRAVNWLRANKRAEQAILLALDENDSSLAAEILNEWSTQAIRSLDLDSLVHWVHAIPADLITRYPALGIHYALANLMLFEYDTAIATINLLANIIDQECAVDDPCRWKLKILRFVEAARYTPPEETLQECLHLLHSAPEGEELLVGLMNHYLAESYEKMGDYAAACGVYQNNYFTSRQAAGMHTEHAHTACALARLYKLQGRLSEAQENFEHAMAYVEQHHLDAGARALAWSGLMEIALERCDPTLDQYNITEITANFEEICASSLPKHYLSILTRRIASYFLAQGEFDQAHRYWTILQRQLRQHACPIPLPEVAILQSDMELCCLARTKTAAAYAARLIRGEPVPCPPALKKTLLARKYLACDNTPAAISLLEAAHAEVERSSQRELLAQIEILLALAFYASGEKQAAFSNLILALIAAEQEGYTRIFLREGSQMKNLLIDFLQNAAEVSRISAQPLPLQGANRIMAAFGEIPSAPELETLPADYWNLSLREQEVVHLLADGKSFKEIASILMVSMNTVKTHVKRIYNKLGVHRRQEIIQVSAALRQYNMSPK